MTTMLAAALAYNPLLLYSSGFQLSVAAVFGILLVRKSLKVLIEDTLLRPFKKPPEVISNLLELAAARVRVLSVEQIAARLEDSLKLLSGHDRTASSRHQTLTGTLDWSYVLFSEPEQ